MKFILTLLMSLLLINCTQNDDETVEHKQIVVGKYKFNFPTTFILIEGQGIDSYIGKIKNSTITINFDYGTYTRPFKGLSEDKFEVSYDTIDNHARQIVKSKDSEKEFTGIHLIDLDSYAIDSENYISLLMLTNHLTIEEQKLVIDVFNSVKPLN